MSVISLDEWRSKAAFLSEQKSPSPQSINWEEIGLQRTDLDESIQTAIGMFITLDRAWRQPFKVGSRFAREGSMLISIAASESFITTNLGGDEWGGEWLITEAGMEMKGELDYVLREIFDAETDTTD